MSTTIKRNISFSLLLIFSTFTLFAAKISVPTMKGPVNDTANILSSREEKSLDSYLRNLDSKTGIQIAVLTIKSLNGIPIEEYSLAVAEKWQLGQKGKDNGALLLVSYNDRQLRIETGYGLEGSLTDVKSGLIIRTVIAPYFQQGKYGEGIVSGIQTMAGIAVGESAGLVDENLTSQIPEKSKDDESSEATGFSIFFLFIFMMIMMTILQSKQRRRRGYYGNNHNSIVKTAVAASILKEVLGNSNHRNGGFGGFGGGGFSGGGGGFGGGGASGGW
jgi:uncharacterized protein